MPHIYKPLAPTPHKLAPAQQTAGPTSVSVTPRTPSTTVYVVSRVVLLRHTIITGGIKGCFITAHDHHTWCQGLFYLRHTITTIITPIDRALTLFIKGCLITAHGIKCGIEGCLLRHTIITRGTKGCSTTAHDHRKYSTSRPCTHTAFLYHRGLSYYGTWYSHVVSRAVYYGTRLSHVVPRAVLLRHTIITAQARNEPIMYAPSTASVVDRDPPPPGEIPFFSWAPSTPLQDGMIAEPRYNMYFSRNCSDRPESF